MTKTVLTLALTLGSLCAALSFNNASDAKIDYLSDSDGQQLVGGACFAVPTGTQSCWKATDPTPFKGCKNEAGEKPISKSPGSWKADTAKNCGVSECGTVPQSKACDS